MTDQPSYNDGDVVNGYRYDAARNEWIQMAAPPVYHDGDVVNGHQYSAALNQWIPLPAAAPPEPAPTSPPSPTVEAWAAPIAPPQSGSEAGFVAPTQALTPVSSAVATVGPGSQGALETRSPQTVIKRRNVLAVWIGLPLITFGLYHWFWYVKINSELRDSNPRIDVKPFLAWLALVPGAILVIPPFVTMYNTGKRIAQAQADAGIGSSCSPVIGVVLMFVFGLNTLYYQSELNKLATAR